MRIEPVKIFNNKFVSKTANKTVSVPISKKTFLISSAGASAIAAATMVKTNEKEICTEDIENKLKEHGYTKNEYDYYQISKLSDEKISRLKDKYGKNYANHMIWKYQNDFEPEDIEKLKNFLNIDKKLGKKMLDKHFDNLMDTYLILNARPDFNLNSKIKNNKDLYTLVTNIITSNLKSDAFESVYNWKGKSHLGVAGTAQTFLREHKSGMPENAQEFTDNLSKAIDSQKLPQSITLYRREGMEVLKKIISQNDNRKLNLTLIMQEISKMKNPDEELKKLKEFILDNEITAIQPSFMATSIDKDLVNHFEGPVGPDGGDKNIIWTFSVAPNTKGLYIEALNADGLAFNEQEVLLQKGTLIKIEDIDYNKQNGMWKIKAKVSN